MSSCSQQHRKGNIMLQLTLLCPDCNVEIPTEGGYTCSQCKTKFRKTPFCSDCGEQLESLKACGNVSYYCNSCRMQKSRTTIDWRLLTVSTQ
ncbi:zinc ribbon domain-containing protein [Vibrio mediterranei]|uniref:zinc ribbon domain-containing protein n=1 Tax=Vibrio mediterranei TaxID=689 RepID=UPI004068E8B7